MAIIQYLKVFISILILSMLISCDDKKVEVLKETQDSIFISFYENGNVKLIGNLSKNRKQGKWISFDKSGAKEYENEYIDDEMEGLQSFFIDQKLKRLELYRNGKKNGLAKYFNECGDVFREGIYKDNHKEGLWYEYYYGKISLIELYNEGKLEKILYENPKYIVKYPDLPPLPPSCDCCSEKDEI